jgi:hypothetical protein
MTRHTTTSAEGLALPDPRVSPQSASTIERLREALALAATYGLEPLDLLSHPYDADQGTVALQVTYADLQRLHGQVSDTLLHEGHGTFSITLNTFAGPVRVYAVAPRKAS